nr:RNA-binding protein cabeza-like [Arachis hypogaea]
MGWEAGEGVVGVGGAAGAEGAAENVAASAEAVREGKKLEYSETWEGAEGKKWKRRERVVIWCGTAALWWWWFSQWCRRRGRGAVVRVGLATGQGAKEGGRGRRGREGGRGRVWWCRGGGGRRSGCDGGGGFGCYRGRGGRRVEMERWGGGGKVTQGG